MSSYLPVSIVIYLSGYTVECWVKKKKKKPVAMSPGPVIDASADAGADQQLPSVENTTHKKKPLPQVAPISIGITFLFSTLWFRSLICFYDLFFFFTQEDDAPIVEDDVDDKDEEEDDDDEDDDKEDDAQGPLLLISFLTTFSVVHVEPLFLFVVFFIFAVVILYIV